MVNWTFGDVRQGGNGIVCDASQLLGVTASLFNCNEHTDPKFSFLKKRTDPSQISKY